VAAGHRHVGGFPVFRLRPQTLRVTPAMAAGVTDHVWELKEIVGLLEVQGKEAASLRAN
jgi:hypothetical protein